jgi:hypothetical protein
MNKLIVGVVTAGMILAGAQVFSGDMQTDKTSKDQKEQLMKDCMTRMAAKNDGSSKEKMKEACKAEMNTSMSKDDNTPKPK